VLQRKLQPDSYLLAAALRVRAQAELAAGLGATAAADLARVVEEFARDLGPEHELTRAARAEHSAAAHAVTPPAVAYARQQRR
jgi:hypothetical protein